MSAEAKPCKTIFVRNLPLTTTNEKLEDIFGDVGPVKRCFVVKDKGSDNCKGFGYVTYSIVEDAEKAKEQITSCDGRRVFVSYANPKEKKKKSKKGCQQNDKSQTVEIVDTVDEREVNKSSPVPNRLTEGSEKAKAKVRAACTVVVTGLPVGSTWNDIHKLAKKHVKNLSEVVYPVPGREEPTAYIRIKSMKAATRAMKKLPTLKLQGSPVSAVLLSEESSVKSQKYLKKCRLIVRNLSFKCREDDLRQTFGKFGELSEVVIPRKAGGKLRGFGIVQFTRLKDANQAIQKVNRTQIKGRPVAVDWAVPKDKYLETIDEPDDEGSFSAESDDGAAGKSPEKKGHVRIDSEEEESDDSGSSDEEEDSAGEGSDEDSEDDSDDDEEEDEDKDEGFSDDSELGGKKKKPSPSKKSDVDQGKTVFIRNLAFDTEQEDLEDFFSQFGQLVYGRIVIDPQTERSRGTAFVQFKNKEFAQKCLETADPDAKEGGLTLDGRRLNITMAVERNKAEELRKEKLNKDPKDKRNLWLAREGLIRPGTQAAEGLSASDLSKRLKVEQMKRQKLKDPRFFISTTRLCVRNIPVKVNDSELRKVFLKAASDKNAIITECRVMRDLGHVNSKGVGKSKGYAFINFKDHKHALQALRNANNNPDLFGDQKRLIVEFSLENTVALQVQSKRQERNLAKQDKIKRLKGENVPVRKKSKAKADAVQPDPSITSDMKKGPKGLPSHWGPKIRHKARQLKGGQKQRDKLSRKEAVENKRKRVEDSVLTEPSKKKRKRGKGRRSGRSEQSDDFDKLVDKYRKTLTKALPKKSKSGKWFE